MWFGHKVQEIQELWCVVGFGHKEQEIQELWWVVRFGHKVQEIQEFWDEASQVFVTQT